MPDDDFVTEFIDKLKKQGLFDRFRKECLADVDTKPAYQNLQLRVKEAVGKYLHSLKWKADLSKNQLRENLRRHLNDLAMLTNGIDRVVDQVVKPKIMKSWKPQIDRSICEHMNIDYEQWLSDQNDAQDKKQTKLEEIPLNIPPPILKTQCPSLVTPSFPTVVNVSVPPPMLNLQPLSIHPLTTTDLQAPPPPPPTSAEESNEPEPSTSSPDPPLPPCPPPLPSEASDDDSAPAPPPDNLQSFSPPPPLPPDDIPIGRDDDDDMSIDEEDVYDGEKAKTSYIETHFSEIQEAREECFGSNDGAKNLPLKEKSTSQMSDFNNSSNFSNDNSFPFPGGNIEQFNTNANNKDYRFAWNNFHESDLSNISVSSVHTSDLSNFEENEDDDSSLNDPGQNMSKNPSSEGNSSKGSDHRLNMTARQSLSESMQDSLDASNASLLSSGWKRLKKEELKERKMEEKKELKRKRVLNRRYCSEEFMSIFNDKQNLLRDKSADDKADAKVTHPGSGHVESSTGGDEEASNKEGNASDVEDAYSPYSNISEASSDSVVVVGVEPARPKKEKKSRSQRRSRSPDGSRKKKKKRRHRSSRRSSRHCSGGDDDVEGCQMKQDVGRNKLMLCEFEGSSRSYPEEEGYLMGEYDDDVSLVEMKKRMKRNVDRISFGEAERQAAAIRTGSIKPTQYPVASPKWQKQMFNTPTKPSRPHAYGLQNFHSMQSPSKHIRHTPSYHQLPLGHSIHEPHVYDRIKHDNEPDVYRLPRGSAKRTYSEGFEDNLNMDETKINKRTRQDDMVNSKGYPRNPVFHSEVEIIPQKKQYEVTDKRNKR